MLATIDLEARRIGLLKRVSLGQMRCAEITEVELIRRLCLEGYVA